MFKSFTYLKNIFEEIFQLRPKRLLRLTRAACAAARVIVFDVFALARPGAAAFAFFHFFLIFFAIFKAAFIFSKSRSSRSCKPLIFFLSFAAIS